MVDWRLIIGVSSALIIADIAFSAGQYWYRWYQRQKPRFNILYFRNEGAGSVMKVAVSNYSDQPLNLHWLNLIDKDNEKIFSGFNINHHGEDEGIEIGPKDWTTISIPIKDKNFEPGKTHKMQFRWCTQTHRGRSTRMKWKHPYCRG
jgi:hypothetical protein